MRLATPMLVPLACALLVSSAKGADETIDPSSTPSIPLPSVAGLALLPDDVTLVASSPQGTELVCLDSAAGQITKRFKVEFQPGALAVQGKTLFASAKGSAAVYAIDPQTGRVLREFKVPGAPVLQLACHPQKGPIFAANSDQEVLAIDPVGGGVTKTEAKGTYMAVDPIRGATLYTSYQPRRRTMIQAQRLSRRQVHVNVTPIGDRAVLTKNAVQGNGARQVIFNPNGVINAHALAISPDGARVAMVGGGGWRPQGAGSGGGYVIPLFDTADVKTALGQVEVGAYPEYVAFHPALDLGVAEKSGGELLLFNSKSAATIRTWAIAGAPAHNSAHVLAFGGRGCKLLYYVPGSTPAQDGRLYLIALPLTDRDKLALKEGPRPPRPVGGTASSSAGATASQAAPRLRQPAPDPPRRSSAPASKPGRSAPTTLANGDEEEPRGGFATSPSRRPEGGVRAEASEESFLGAKRDVGDAAVTELTLNAREILPCMAWAPDGRSFYALERGGVLHRIALDGLRGQARLDVGHHCAWLSLSKEGLLLTVSDSQEVWVLDPVSLRVKRTIDLPAVSRAVSSPALSVAFAAGQGDPPSTLAVVDLRSGKVVGHQDARKAGAGLGFGSPVVTPSGKYLLAVGSSRQIVRFRINGTKLERQEDGPGIGDNIRGLELSPDGYYVAMPCGAGNSRRVANHPPLIGYGTFVYKITRLSKPEIVVVSGAYPQALGFDTKAGYLLAQNHDKPLILFKPNGAKHKEYDLPGAAGHGTRQFLVHPDGGKVIVVNSAIVDLVEFPSGKGGPSAGGG
jgi:hypothetical protein